MSNYQTIGSVSDNAGSLRHVSYVFEQGLPDESDSLHAVLLQFDGLIAVVYAKPEFDTIGITLSPPTFDDWFVIIEQTEQEPWSRAIGLQCIWLWLMTNQQGYEDGLRIEFGNPDSAEYICIDFVVVASEIKLYISQPLPTASK